jgi:hypothetical protein
MGLSCHSFAENMNAKSVLGVLENNFVEGELRYCNYVYDDIYFYVVQQKEKSCHAVAIGEILEPKKVKKPSLKIPRLWKHTHKQTG